ncbi:GreA/GreB family elongation factor [Candidatus Clavichlamydia salmonicola]|uniref:GreA/GreB family elongation factor n=1 Tax=Candidatus Clavichlamydia salmonicola TaxID=469812 RepID=UPI00189103B2|nr:GreA/GreB family elongation factor [Candidatus Clavichlamydia salmonicola]
MDYLEKFQLLLEDEQLTQFFKLWEEYCLIEEVDGKELITLLESIKKSSLASFFGNVAETVLLLWERMQDGPHKERVLALLMDLQNTNTPILGKVACQFLEKKYSKDEFFSEGMRIVGLRALHSFQGSVANYQLLTHMKKGAFVFHTGGWGVGEVMEISFIQERVIIEFEGFCSLKDLSFEIAFKSLRPIPLDHFLARRFGDPDTLELFGKEKPIELVKLLLRDLGPKTAQEIKDELVELVIPDDEWNKWWQAARSKIKKDTKIISPKTARNPFYLTEEEISHGHKLKQSLAVCRESKKKLLLIYNFLRDFPLELKEKDIKDFVKEELVNFVKTYTGKSVEDSAIALESLIFLQDLFGEEFAGQADALIVSIPDIDNIINAMDIMTLKKNVLVTIQKKRDDWREIFQRLFFTISFPSTRDFIFKELSADKEAFPVLEKRLYELLERPTLYPDAFIWFLQKWENKEDNIIPHTEDLKRTFLESVLILLHFLGSSPNYKELGKKLYQFLVGQRYLNLRKLIEGASLEFLKEFLLLASKCPQFSKEDLRILRNLAEVVDPLLKSKEEPKEVEVIWTTQESFLKMRDKLQHIGETEVVENAKEIEAARALGDLRENSEYKFALEKRARLQGELKVLSDQIGKSRILTENDICLDEVGVGCVVEMRGEEGKALIYTILGVWDADADKGILSIQSQVAQNLLKKKKGDIVSIQGKEFVIKEITSCLVK